MTISLAAKSRSSVAVGSAARLGAAPSEAELGAERVGDLAGGPDAVVAW